MRSHRLFSVVLGSFPVLGLVGLLAQAACGNGDDTGSPAASASKPDASLDGTTGSGDASGSKESDADDAGAPTGDAGPSAGDAEPDGGLSADGSTVDSLVTSFVSLGCNRVAKGDWLQASNPSSANVPQLQQDFTDVAGLANTPRHLFFTGDLVLGETPTLSTITSQLDGWASLFAASPIASSVALIPVAGNHELLNKITTSDGGSAEVQNNALGDASADQTWLSFVQSHGYPPSAWDGGANGPTPTGSNPDQVVDDQSSLSYSFDDKGVHYVILNTDTWTAATDNSGAAPIGWVPLTWLAHDLAVAQANPAVSEIFVFGHKPIVAPDGATDSADVVNPSQNSQLQDTLNAYAKVKAYFCAHYHAWDIRQLYGTLPDAHGVYQIIAGNGGSTLEATWTPPVTYYGFTEVRVYASGKVGVVSHQRPVPTPYDSDTGVLPAVAQPEILIAQ